MQFRHIGREIGIALVGADDNAAGLGDRKIAARHAGIGGQDQRTVGLALCLRQVVHVAVVGIGTDRLCEHLRDVRPELVHGRHDDMARIFVVELLDALTEVGLDHLDPDRCHVRPETALLGEHRLALDQRLGAVIGKNAVNGTVMLGGVARPMHMDPVRARIGLELVEIVVEPGKRVLLDGRGQRPQLFPFGNAMHLAVPLLTKVPQPLVMHLLVLGRGDEARRRRRLVDRPVAMDFGAARLLLGLRPQRLRGRLGVVQAATAAVNGVAIVASQKLGMEHGVLACWPCGVAAHALAPLRIWAMWMNLIGTPMRSAQPC